MVQRIFRVWEKKRGHRHTGSPVVGSVGEAIFFGAMFLLGSVSLAGVFASQLVNPTPEIYTPGFGFWLMVLVLASFVLIGGSGVVYTALHVGTSAERRSALVRRAAGLDLIRDALPSLSEYPTVPRDAHLTNSPGVILTFRLPTVQSSKWKLWFATLFFLVCTALSSVLLVVALDSFVLGVPEWFLSVSLLPLLALNAWSFRLFLREIWEEARIGPTYLEISDHPLQPGKEYAIFFSQAGRTALRSLEMSLLCLEEATYVQGTDIRKETCTVFRERICRFDGIRPEPGTPFEAREKLRIPEQAMHSFQSGHNAVHWKIVIKGRPESRPSFLRSFPVIVYPPRGDIPPT
jgi:hypothetical protein